MNGRILAGTTALLLVAACGGNGAAGGGNNTAGNGNDAAVSGDNTVGSGNNSAGTGAANSQFVGRWRYANSTCAPSEVWEFTADGRIFQGGRLGGTWTADGNTIMIATQMRGTWESVLSGDTIMLGGHGGAAGGSLVRCPG